jgi:hypothetical protein
MGIHHLDEQTLVYVVTQKVMTSLEIMDFFQAESSP